MNRLRAHSSLKITMFPPSRTKQSIQLCFLNARSLHQHLDDVRHDLYFASSDMCMFVETRFFQCDTDNMFTLECFTLFRNDGQSSSSNRPYGGTAIYTNSNVLQAFLIDTIEMVLRLQR